MESQIKGFIYEFDGVMLETDIYHFLSWKKALAENDIKVDQSIKELINGVDRERSLINIMKSLELDITKKEVEEISALKNKYFIEMVEDFTLNDLYPQIIESIRWAKSNDIKVAIITTSTNAKHIINKIGLDKEVDIIINTESNRGQNYLDSEILVDASKNLGILQWEALAILGNQRSINEANECLMKTIAIDFERRIRKANVNLSTTRKLKDEFLNKIMFELSIDETL